jgi:hypothetical protein
VRGRVWLETLSVSIAVAGLFGFLGLATVDAELTREWSGQASVPVLGSITILGEELVVSAALLQVAGFLGALAALMFALEVLVEEESRHELIDDLLEGYTRAVTVWAADEAGSADKPTATQSLSEPAVCLIDGRSIKERDSYVAKRGLPWGSFPLRMIRSSKASERIAIHML